MNWADANNVNYLGWSWQPGNSLYDFVTNNNGTCNPPEAAPSKPTSPPSTHNHTPHPLRCLGPHVAGHRTGSARQQAEGQDRRAPGDVEDPHA